MFQDLDNYKEMLKEYEEIVDNLIIADLRGINLKYDLTDKEIEALENYNIFKYTKFDDLKKELIGESKKNSHYVLRRWTLQKMSRMCEILFAINKKADDEINKRDINCDVHINGEEFDIKTHMFPNKIKELGSNQFEKLVNLNKIEGRKIFYKDAYHNHMRNSKTYQNRIFILFKNDYDTHWLEPRLDIPQIKIKIKKFVENPIYDEVEIDGNKVKCAIIIISNSQKHENLFMPNTETIKT